MLLYLCPTCVSGCIVGGFLCLPHIGGSHQKCDLCHKKRFCNLVEVRTPSSVQAPAGSK